MSKEPNTPRSEIITFYSYKGGVGRTMALANVAWILAGTGRRVLTVDWDLESPGLHLYFMPFLADRKLRHSRGVIDAITEYRHAYMTGGPLAEAELRRLAKVERFATSLERYEFPHGGSIDFVPGGRQSPEYSATVSNFDWSEFWEKFDGQTFLSALAANMRANYDVVLIDSRTGLSDNAGICTVELPDTVVNCFTFNNQNIEGAAAAARSIRAASAEAGTNIRILPVPTRVEDGEAAKLDRWRTMAQHQFGPLVAALGHADPAKYWGAVEIPYRVFYAYEETLAIFGDRPHQKSGLLAAYQRLTGELVGEDVGVDALPDAVRHGWVAEFEQRGPVTTGTLVIGYTPRDRIWAEWAAYQLRLVGQRSTLQDYTADSFDPADLGSADQLLVLLSQESVRMPQTRALWQAATRRDAALFGRFLVPVRLDGFRLPEPFDHREAVDMFNVSGDYARDALLARLGLSSSTAVADIAVGGGPRPRFPFQPARVWRAPSRNNNFTGRDAILEELRERLNASTAVTGPAVVQGIGGVGKTQIVAEYLHRFAADYDIVWWISADQPTLVPAALADLAATLELPGAVDVNTQTSAVLEALRLGEPSPRWAVVFDNTDDPAQLAPYMPTGGGDVIVTTRGGEWSRKAWTIDINVFNRAESIELLRRRVPDIDPANANAIADKLGDLPLAVEQAATWLAATAMSTSSYLQILDEHLPRILETVATEDYPHPAAQIWRLSQDRLRKSNPAAARMVELCAMFAPEPIPTSLLSNPGMVRVLGGAHPGFRDPLLYGSLVRELTRYGLARQDSSIYALRMHRLVQNVIRGDLAQEVARERRRQVHDILAAEVRGDPDDRESWPAYHRLLPHLEPTGALESSDPDVQQLVIDMVRSLRSRGDMAGSLDVATRALKIWRDRSGPADGAVLRIRGELANTLRSLGRPQEALDIDEELIAAMGSTFGEQHPYTLIVRRGRAGDLRGLGRYAQARDSDEQSLVEWQAVMGPDDPEALKAANNAATSRRLTGDFSGALALSEDVLERRRRVLGPEHYYTLYSRTMYGRDLRDVGMLAQSREVLENAYTVSARVLGERHATTLMAGKNLCVTLRRLDVRDQARKVIDEVVAGYESTVGGDHADTLAASLERACVLSAAGEHEVAEETAVALLDRYRSVRGERHPFTLAAANDLTIFRVRGERIAPARALIEETAERFADVLGAEHPHTLVAQSNRATVLYRLGELAAAHSLDERCYTLLRARLDNDNPMVVAAAANLVITREAGGDAAGAAQMRTDTLRICISAFGTDHPFVESLRHGRRVSTDIEPAET